MRAQTKAERGRLIEDMVSFFTRYDTQEGVPSFEKFAAAQGLAGESELLALAARHADVQAAMRRCRAILRDRISDAALLRRFDPSFCKYLLDTLACQAENAEDAGAFEVEVRIV